MLTISQAAGYLGVTTRTIRHWHAIGLVADPPRNASGYRVYAAGDLVELRRVRVLRDAGVPLARIKAMLADPESIRAAVMEVDRDLRARIRNLQRTRQSLAALPDGPDAFLPPSVAALLDEMRARGISERMLAIERDGWLLHQVLYPGRIDEWVDIQRSMLDDPELSDIYRLVDEAYHWPAADPRTVGLAARLQAYGGQCQALQNGAWEADRVAFDLVAQYGVGEAPAWDELMDLLAAAVQDSAQEQVP